MARTVAVVVVERCKRGLVTENRDRGMARACRQTAAWLDFQRDQRPEQAWRSRECPPGLFQDLGIDPESAGG
jgi:hypothetical protein